MKRFFFLLLVMIFINSIAARKYKLIQAAHFLDVSKDCSYTGDCVSSKYLIKDTLHLTIFISNNGRDLDSYLYSFSYLKDTLNLYLENANVIKIKVFNKLKRRMETHITSRMSIKQLLERDDQRFVFALTGFRELPKVIQFEHATLCDCPVKPIQFEICDNDTINMINANGHKHGIWVDFYDTGEIMKKKKYIDGKFIDGYYYNLKGEKTHKIQEREIEIAIPIELTK
jgi:hypothetical protein